MSSKPIEPEEFASVSDAKPVRSIALETSKEHSPSATLKGVLADVLGLDALTAEDLNADSGLFGHMPELDSMAVAGLLTEIEDRFDIVIEDDDVDGEMLETFGGLLDFVISKSTGG